VHCNSKIIDLGLAKSAPGAPAKAAISTPGAFAGPPEFASPEQFAGVQVDIRSDLYSLGVVLWQMVTGHAVFRGSPAEVMYQHQHAPVPLDLLEAVPQPVAVLLEILLEKDPARRFQNPTELLKAMPTITGAIDSRRRITRRSFQKTFPADSRVGTRKPSTRLAPKKISLARLPVTGSDVFGREEDLTFLDDAWANQNVNVVTIVAWATLGRPMNLFTRLSLGLVIQIHGWEGRGRKARDSRSSSRIVEPYWFWMAWSRSKIRN
jgi:serine/threonine protein kinase